MNTIEFEINPIAKPRMVRSDRWANRKVVNAYWVFKDSLVYLAKSKKFELPDAFEVIFYIEMPKSWSEKKRFAMSGKAHQLKPDLDNLVKAIDDCLKEKDQSIYDIRARKYWSFKGSIIIKY